MCKSVEFFATLKFSKPKISACILARCNIRYFMSFCTKITTDSFQKEYIVSDTQY